jgi:hypothetical protein
MPSTPIHLVAPGIPALGPVAGKQLQPWAFRVEGVNKQPKALWLGGMPAMGDPVHTGGEGLEH